MIADAPVQFVFAGKAHPGDEAGKEMIRRLVAFASEPAMRGRFVSVGDYDMALSRALVQGADVWLNTPVHPLEASGTSGMKAALNGALNLSVLDGWWAEGFDSGLSDLNGRTGPGRDEVPNGWAMAAIEATEEIEIGPASERRAGLDSEALYELIENQVLPLWLERGSPRPWWDRVRRSLYTLGPLVDAHRMVDEYVDHMYSPAAQTAGSLAADGHAGARALAAFRQRAALRWGGVRVARVDADESTGDLGTARQVSASVLLGDLSPEEVDVQLLVGHLGPGGQLVNYAISTMSLSGDSLDDQGCLDYRAHHRPLEPRTHGPHGSGPPPQLPTRRSPRSGPRHLGALRIHAGNRGVKWSERQSGFAQGSNRA